ncbi:MAG TPA: N-carbamoylsarcosine amidohydrolase, partial [Clostridiales bacterium]|nr:N-carbamoylsarcosine amidohydrolase [Clostridiales bacterium]
MKKCLIIVDYQNDFVSGALGFPEAAALAPRLAEKIRTYKAQGDDVIFTFDTHGENYS